MALKHKASSSCESKSGYTFSFVILYVPNKPILALYKAISIHIGAHLLHHQGSATITRPRHTNLYRLHKTMSYTDRKQMIT